MRKFILISIVVAAVLMANAAPASAAEHVVSQKDGAFSVSTLKAKSGDDQVNIAVTQMDQVVQQNASLVEEATAATESMKNQAAVLLRMVSRFKLGAEQVDVTQLHAQPAWPDAPAVNTPAPIKVRSKARLAPAQVAALRPPSRHAGVANGQWKEF
jgi:methyl-accepting chemotaxis protein